MKSYKSYATGADVAINSGDVYHTRRVRTGKTGKDAKNGNARRNSERKQMRADWQKNASKTSPAPFPV